MRFSWIRARGAVVVSAAVMALQGAPALAQFVPYTPSPSQGYNQYQAHTAQQPQVQYAQPQYDGQQQFAQPQAAQPQYTAMAFQAGAAQVNSSALGQPVESIGPGQSMQSVPMQSYSAAPAPGCNCQTNTAPAVNYAQSAPAAMGFESYASGGSCGTYNTFNGGCGVGAPYASCDMGCDTGCGYIGSGLGARRCGRQWFGGFYGLYMERAGNPWRALAFSTLDTNGAGYYPTDTEYVMNLTDLDLDTFAGAEARLGATFGGRRDACGCGCGPRWAWEVAYWALDEETAVATVTDTAADGNRLYGMIDQRGKEFDPGSGYRPLNHYFDYGPPASDYTNGGALDELQIRSLTARSSFSMQNIEANFLRLPMLACNGAAGCGGCGSRYSVTGLAGFRYIRLDDDFMFSADGENIDTPGTYSVSHSVDVDSHLAGAQLGCKCDYTFGNCGRWGVHCNAAAGVFNNHSEVWNRGSGRFANNGNADFDLRYEDDNVAVLGELRAGASYQYSCNWRLFGGYRLLGLSGIALAYEQITQPASISPAQVSYVDGDGSIFMHGLQGGIECTY